MADQNQGTMLETVIASCTGDPSDKFALGIVIRRQLSDQPFDALAAMRAAAADFLATDRGKAEIASNSGAFNWGDFVNSVPDSFCKRHGFTVEDTFVTDLLLDHDESLIPEG